MAFLQVGNVQPFSTVDWAFGDPPTVSSSLARVTANELDFGFSNGFIGAEFGVFTVIGGTVFGTVTSALLVDSRLNTVVAISSANLTSAQALASSPNQFDSIALAGNDFIVGGAAQETLFGFGGNDTIFGQSGNTEILAGAGQDWLISGSGKTFIGMGSHVGTDFIFVGSGATTIGAAGNVGASVDLVVGFKAGIDSLAVVRGTGGINTAQDAQAHLVSDGRGSTFFLAGAEIMLIGGVQPSQIDAAHIQII